MPDEDEADLVRQIFERYVGSGEGSMSIAKWLNEKADYTRRGAKWTPKKVIGLIRNPTYIGQLPFKGEAYGASHEALVTAKLFDRANELLDQRGESWKLRRSNPSDYLLSGVLRCDKCGHGFIGTVGHGKSGGSYRYYVCYSRRRHGRKTCDQDFIPADRIEARMIAAVLAELADGSLFRAAAESARRRWNESRSTHSTEIQRLQRRIDSRRGALDRYLKAFEAGSLSEETCSHRVREVENDLVTLEEELASLEAEAEPPRFGDEALDDLRAQIEKALNRGQPQKLKKLLVS